jgi:hypothetical protein
MENKKSLDWDRIIFLTFCFTYVGFWTFKFLIFLINDYNR